MKLFNPSLTKKSTFFATLLLAQAMFGMHPNSYYNPRHNPRPIEKQTTMSPDKRYVSKIVVYSSPGKIYSTLKVFFGPRSKTTPNKPIINLYVDGYITEHCFSQTANIYTLT